MSAKQRKFGIELDQHGTPQLSEAAAASDTAAHKRLLKKIRKAFLTLGNEHPKTNIVVVIESGYSGRILLAEARHCSNDPVWQDAVLYNIVGAVKMKNRNRSAALSEFNHAYVEGVMCDDKYVIASY